MFHELVADPGNHPPEELQSEYAAALAAIVDERGVGAVADAAGLDRETVEAARAGDLDDVTLEGGAAILALDRDAPSADTIQAASRDALLMGMSNAVLDVETLERTVDGVLSAREIQHKVEGRFPLTLAEYALLVHYIERRY